MHQRAPAARAALGSRSSARARGAALHKYICIHMRARHCGGRRGITLDVITSRTCAPVRLSLALAERRRACESITTYTGYGEFSRTQSGGAGSHCRACPCPWPCAGERGCPAHAAR